MSPDRKIVNLTTLMITVLMSVFFSGQLSFMSLCLTTAWLAAWARGFVIAWPMQTTVALLVGPLVQGVAAKFVASR
jgi:hypothetical protein